MIIPEKPRPWAKKVRQGTRYNPDPFYHTNEWKQTKIGFTLSTPWQNLPPINGLQYKNCYCADCWKEGKMNEHDMTDHVTPITLGGSRTDYNNLQSLCNRHHAIKSAKEKNAKYKK